jgi:hypothetical protein
LVSKLAPAYNTMSPLPGVQPYYDVFASFAKQVLLHDQEQSALLVLSLILLRLRPFWVPNRHLCALQPVVLARLAQRASGLHAGSDAFAAQKDVFEYGTRTESAGWILILCETLLAIWAVC